MKCSPTAAPLVRNEAVEPAQSVVLRFLEAVDFPEITASVEPFRRLLERCSLREGARLFPLLTYAGVDVFVLDESSAMHTGTLKSIDGCVTSAACLAHGFRRIVFETGGNTGNALTVYGRHAGLETFCVVPEENLTLLDRDVFDDEQAHLIAVRDPAMVRPVAERLAARFDVARVPRVDWRIVASRFRGCFILEHLQQDGAFSHLVQTISAGFGPIGIYDVLERHGATLPTFVGVQQAGNCAMFRARQTGSRDLAPIPVASTAALLSPVMYDAHPGTYGTYDALANLLDRTGGHITTIDHAEFDRAFGEHDGGRHVMSRLAEQGFAVGRRDGRIIDKTGLMAIAGTLKQIDAGMIPHGSRVLCAMTSGAGTADGLARPDLTVSDPDAFEREARARWFRGDHA